MSFSERLILARTRSEYTQEEFANLLGIARSTYANYESDNREPGFDLLVKMGDTLHVSSDWLLGRTNDPNISLSSSERDRFDDFINEAALLFNDENVEPEDKEKMIASLTEIYWQSKLLNKAKRKK